MSELPVNSADRARKNEAIVLQRLLSVGQVTVAKALNLSESTISRRKDGDITEFARILAVLGLKVVPEGMQCYRPEDIRPYIELAKQHMQRLEGPHQLIWEDERGA